MVDIFTHNRIKPSSKPGEDEHVLARVMNFKNQEILSPAEGFLIADPSAYRKLGRTHLLAINWTQWIENLLI